jgi:hypothetical protein
MVKLFGNEAKSAFIKASKSKAIDDTFVTIPPGDSRETLRKEKRASATPALLAAEDD